MNESERENQGQGGVGAQPPSHGISYEQRPGGAYVQPTPPQGGAYAQQTPPQGGYGQQSPPSGAQYAQQAPPRGTQYAQQARPQGHRYGQTPPSGYYGYGPQPIPPEVKRWNWGAFILNWIWGCGNGAYLALLCLIPGFNLVWVFVCGAKGNEWAWKSGKFKDLDTFLTTQRTWNIAGIILFCLSLLYVVVIIVSIVIGLMPWTDFVDDMGYREYESWY
jgi:hypothetical protein